MKNLRTLVALSALAVTSGAFAARQNYMRANQTSSSIVPARSAAIDNNLEIANNKTQLMPQKRNYSNAVPSNVFVGGFGAPVFETKNKLSKAQKDAANQLLGERKALQDQNQKNMQRISEINTELRDKYGYGWHFNTGIGQRVQQKQTAMTTAKQQGPQGGRARRGQRAMNRLAASNTVIAGAADERAVAK